MAKKQRTPQPRNVEAQLKVLRNIKTILELETILVTCCAVRQRNNGMIRYGAYFDQETVEKYIMERKLEEAIFGV